MVPRRRLTLAQGGRMTWIAGMNKRLDAAIEPARRTRGEDAQEF